MREAIIDTGAITANVRRLKTVAGVPEFIAVVKADGYGHGALRSARAAIDGGATRVATADLEEAMALVRQGIREVPVLAWSHRPGPTLSVAAAHGIEIGVGSNEQLEAAAAAAGAGRPTRIHIQLETGPGRGGASLEDWPTLFTRARRLHESGRIDVVGLFSHLSGASRQDDLGQVRAFDQGVDIANLARLDPPLLHLAATSAAIWLPEARFNAVRVGLGIYGLSPTRDESSAPIGLRPAMTLRAPVVAVRRVGAHHGVSYDHTYRTSRSTTLALVPLGYADGIPRSASYEGAVTLHGRRYPLAGRIAMDQLVIDVGDDAVRVGDVVTVFGDPARGAVSADEWARAAGTINYEIVTRIGARVTRRSIGALQDPARGRNRVTRPLAPSGTRRRGGPAVISAFPARPPGWS
ncbi:alanine racemase [Lysobacter korlensis]|uniref:Alanine racemase n=1 Tax=Lysobacter korlensis TaxID=553636 RepID=A0ABV6RUD2_9GAMM